RGAPGQTCDRTDPRSKTMTMRLRMVFCAAASLALCGAPGAVASEGPKTVPAGTDPKLISAIKKANSDFEVATAKGDVATIVEPSAADALFITSDGTMAKGRDQIEQLYRDRFAKAVASLDAKIESDQVVVAGDMAYESGRGSLTHTVKYKRETDWARLLTIWRRQPDGGGKIIRNIVLPGKSRQPPPESARRE